MNVNVSYVLISVAVLGVGVWGQLAQLNCKKPHVTVLVLILKPELGHVTPSASAPGYDCIILGGRCNSIVGESEPEVP